MPHHALLCSRPSQSYAYNYDVAKPTFDLGLDVCSMIVSCVTARLRESRLPVVTVCKHRGTDQLSDCQLCDPCMAQTETQSKLKHNCMPDLPDRGCRCTHACPASRWVSSLMHD